MNVHSPRLQPTELQLIDGALHALLSASIVYDRERSLLPERGLEAAGDVAARVVEKLKTFTDTQRKADAYLARPVRAALREALFVLGERLFEIGGMRAMHEAMSRASALDTTNPYRREEILNGAWDGIGGQWFP